MVPERVLGKAIKEERLRKGYTLRRLGERAGLSQPFLSKIENGKTVPSILNVGKIAKALGVTIAELLDCLEENAEVDLTIVRAQRRPIIARDGAAFGYSYEALASSARQESVGTFIVRFSSRVKRTTTPFTHRGYEFNFVLSGRVDFVYGEAVYLLEEGDSVFYNASVPHYGVVHQVEEAAVLAVVVG